jgi:cold shock CspA family protein
LLPLILLTQEKIVGLRFTVNSLALVNLQVPLIVSTQHLSVITYYPILLYHFFFRMYPVAVPKAFTVAVVGIVSIWIASDDVKLIRSVSAWVSSPSRMATMKSSSSSLYMFDWMNPKKNVDEKKNDDNSNDFFGNMFKVSTPTSEEAVAEQKIDSVSVVATTVEPPAAKEQDKKMEDDVIVSINAGESKENQEEKEGDSVAVPVVTTTAASTSSTDSIHHGRVRWFDSKKGYGFLSEVDKDGKYINAKKDFDTAIFVHQSNIVVEDPKYFRRLFDRELVDFRLEHDANGRFKATNVTGFGGAELRTVQRQKEVEAAKDPQKP